MVIIGIDPGKTGAVACWSDGWSVDDCPTVEILIGGKKRTAPETGEMADLLERIATSSVALRDGVHAYVELVNAMPSIPGKDGKRRGMGATSAFSFGRNYGQWEGVLSALHIPHTFVLPKTWKKGMGCKVGKDAGRLRAIELFPDMRHRLTRKKDHGRADAMLIAEYGRREMAL